MEKILVIEDESHISEGIKFNLSKLGYEISIAENGVVGLERWQSFKPNLIILDLMLPKLDGYAVLKKIREVDEKIPILILSAKNETADKIKGFSHGVDDYIPKPFDLDELLLRVQRLLKQRSWHKDNDQEESEFLVEVYEFGNNKILFKELMAHTANGEIQLTEQEAKLLELFILKKNELLSRQQILASCWGYSETVESRTIDNFIVRLRKYFEKNPKKPEHFLSIRGRGYKFIE